MIGNNDLWIAAHALAAGLILVTNHEKELRRLGALKVQKLGGTVLNQEPPSGARNVTLIIQALGLQ
jgi:hypothetical protein